MTAAMTTMTAATAELVGAGPDRVVAGSERDVVRGLVSRAQAGDAAAFGVLYERYVGTVHQFLFYKVRRDRHLAEDLTSEVFVRALRGISRFVWLPGSTFGAWLLTIARNLVIDHIKSGRTRLETVADPAEVAAQVHDVLAAGPDTDPETTTLTHETNLALLHAVNRLPATQREVVLMRFWLQLSTHEVAQALGIRLGAVKSRQTRAMDALARAVPAEDPRGAHRNDTRARAGVGTGTVTS